MNSIDIVLAIKALNNNAEIVVYGDDIDTCTIEWRAGAEISKADIKASELCAIDTAIHPDPVPISNTDENLCSNIHLTNSSVSPLGIKVD